MLAAPPGLCAGISTKNKYTDIHNAIAEIPEYFEALKKEAAQVKRLPFTMYLVACVPRVVYTDCHASSTSEDIAVKFRELRLRLNGTFSFVTVPITSVAEFAVMVMPSIPLRH